MLIVGIHAHVGRGHHARLEGSRVEVTAPMASVVVKGVELTPSPIAKEVALIVRWGVVSREVQPLVARVVFGKAEA